MNCYSTTIDSSCPPDRGWLPFAKLNLLRNPFGQLAIDDWTRAAVVDCSNWVSMIRDSMSGGPMCALQFMGDCGRGKTTHLRAIQACFPESAYVYLPEGNRLPKVPHGRPLIIDEAQRATRWMRWNCFRRGVPIVLGTHADLSASLQRHGYRVTTVVVSDHFSAELLDQIIQRRIELARISPQAVPQVDHAQIESLIERYGSDIRAIQDDLYDQFQAMV